MFRHLLKALWKRKSRNLMLSIEILLAFVVVFAIVATAARYAQLYRMPIGFDYQDVWSVQMQAPDDDGIRNDATLYEQFQRSLQALPEIRQVAFANSSPFELSTWNTDYYLPEGGASIQANLMRVSDGFFDVTGMQLQEGRWFSSADEGAAEAPVMVDRRFAEQFFPGGSAVGQRIFEGAPGSEQRTALRIKGVFETFRNHGELMTPVPFVLTRFSPQAGGAGVSTLLLRLQPGTTRAFEARLSVLLKQIRNDWSYRISPLSELRASTLGVAMAPLIVVSVIAAFLLLMVAFGLFGVLWQNTTRRIPEFGMRRAVGASRGNIYGQVIVEQLLLSALAMGFGLLLLVQLPITQVFGEHLDWPLFLVAALGSIAIMSLVSLLGALYPAWRASTLSPTQALHYE